MYEYFPREPKRKELLILFGLLGGGFFLFGISKNPSLPFPAILQLLSVVLFCGVVVVLTRYLLRDFSYSIEPRDGVGAPDLVVREFCGKRISVVCRISLGDVVEVRPVCAKEARDLAKQRKGRCVYNYTCHITPKGLYLLTVRDGESLYDLRIVADERLISYLSHQ